MILSTKPIEIKGIEGEIREVRYFEIETTATVVVPTGIIPGMRLMIGGGDTELRTREAYPAESAGNAENEDIPPNCSRFRWFTAKEAWVRKAGSAKPLSLLPFSLPYDQTEWHYPGGRLLDLDALIALFCTQSANDAERAANTEGAKIVWGITGGDRLILCRTGMLAHPERDAKPVLLPAA